MSHKTLRNVLIGLMTVIVLLVALPAVLVNKDDVRQQLSQVVYEKTGRSLELGTLNFAILPSPRFTVEEVRLSNWENSPEPWMISVDKITVIAAPMDLLSGKVTARTVMLDGPNIILEQRKGQKNWKFLPPGTLPERVSYQQLPPNTLDVSKALAQGPATAQMVQGLGVDVAFEQVQIRRGKVTYSKDEKASPIIVADINLDVDAKTMSGPFVGKGALKYAGQDLTLNAVVDDISGDRAIPLRVDVQSAAMSLQADGLVLQDTGTGPVLNANIAIKTDNLGKTLEALGQSASQAVMGVPVALVGDLRAGAEKGEIKSGQLQVGPDQVKTEARWTIENNRPNVILNLDAQRLQLDNWLQAKTASLSPSLLPSVISSDLIAPAYADTAAAPQVLTIPKLPRDMDVTLTAKADTTVLRGQAVHNLTVDAVLSQGDLVVNKLSADVPGAANINVFGFVATAQDKPSVDLTAQAKAANLRGTLSWLGVDVGHMPADRLRRAAVNTAIRLADDNVLQLRDMELTLDSSKATGAADIRLAERLGLGLSLAVDQVNLDAYRPVKGEQTAYNAEDYKIIYAAADEVRKGPDPVPSMDLSAFQILDANVNLSVGRLIASKQVFDKVNLQGTLQNGDLTISKLYAGLGYAGQITAAGLMQTLGQRVPQLQDIKVAVKSSRGDKLMRLLGNAPKFTQTWRKLNATINASGPLDRLSTNALIVAGKTSMHAVGKLNILSGLPVSDTQINVTAPTLGDFAKAFGGSVASGLAGLKNVKLSAPVQYQKTGLAMPAIAFRATGAQDIKVDGNVVLKTDGPRPYVTANLSGNTLPIFAELKPSSYVSKAIAPQAKIIPAAYVPVAVQTQSGPFSALRSFDGILNAKFDRVVTPKISGQNVVVSADLNQGILNVTKATANVLGGLVNATGQVDVRKTPSMSAKVKANNVSLSKDNPLFGPKGAPLTGLISLDADVSSAGLDHDAMLQALNGSGSFSITEGTLLGADLDAVNAKIANIRSINDVLEAIGAGQSGRTVFDTLKGSFTIDKGSVRSDDIAIAAPSGVGAVGGVANLFSRTMDVNANYTLANLKDAPALGVRLQGAWDNPRVRFDIQEFQGYVLQRGIGQFLNLLNKKSGNSQSQTEQNTTTEDSSATSSEQPQQQQQKKKLKLEDAARGLFQLLQQ